MKGRTADLPLEERQARETEQQQEIRDGIDSRHVANAAYERAYQAAQFARVPLLAAKLRGD